MLEFVVAGFELGTSLQDHHQSQSISLQASFLWFFLLLCFVIIRILAFQTIEPLYQTIGLF